MTMAKLWSSKTPNKIQVRFAIIKLINPHLFLLPSNNMAITLSSIAAQSSP